jgi:hypothetical protein
VQGAERALGRLDGVRDVEAIVGSLKVRIVPAPDRTLDFARLKPTLWSVGIRAQKIQIVADGSIESPGTFRIRGWPDAYPVKGLGPDQRPTRLRAAVNIRADGPHLQAISE